MGHDVFISHSSKDKRAADAVCAALETNGIRCWIAPRNINSGEDWAEAIINGIDGSRVMVLVFSGHANESPQVGKEVGLAADAKIPIAPIRIEDVRPKGSLRYHTNGTHWLDALTPPLETHLREFTVQVLNLLKATGDPPRPAPNLSVPGVGKEPGAAVSIGDAAVERPPRETVTREDAPPADLRANLGSARTDFTNTLGMKFKRIEPGTFTMGSPETEEGHDKDEVQHEVNLTKPFFMGIHHVTRGQFAAFAKAAPYQTDAEKAGSGGSWKAPGFDQTDDHPVVWVSWNDAVAFCRWLSQKEGKSYRLPTEAEWEYACRAGTRTAYFWGDESNGGQGFANCRGLRAKDKFPCTTPVGSFKPNLWGLYDMTGNAWQWCSDVYSVYPGRPVKDPIGPEQIQNASRVLRGGSFCSNPAYCRSAYRRRLAPGTRYDDCGFRVALDSR